MVDDTSGRLLEWSPGRARAEGLAQGALGDRVEIHGSGPALVTALASDHVELLPLSSTPPAPGAAVRGIGRFEVPAGEPFIGRSVDALGRPLDGRGPIIEDGRHPLFPPAPPLRPDVDRRRLSVGLWVYDFRQPVPLGATVLAAGGAGPIGGHIARHLLRHQAREGRVCIYALLTPGSSAAPASRAVFERFDRGLGGSGDAASFIVVEPGPDPTPGAVWLIPWAALAMAAHFRDRGRDAVVVLDSLDPWRRSALALPSQGSWQTQLGRLLGLVFAAASGSASLFAVASPALVRSVAPMVDVHLDLDRALRGYPPPGGALVRPPFKVCDPAAVASALAAVAGLEELEARAPWTAPPAGALRIREALRFRPGMSAELVEQLAAFRAVCEREDLPAGAVPEFMERFLQRLRADHAALLADIRKRREYRDQDHRALMAVARQVR